MLCSFARIPAVALVAISMTHAAENPVRTATIPCADDWQEAATLDGFTLANTLPEPKPATEPTVVHARYTVDALWLRIVAQESAMARLNKGCPDEPGTVDNPLEWTGDVLEIFVHPDADSPPYHLALNPNGARWDEGPGGTAWNGTWSVTTSLGADAWEAVVRIPFADVQELGGGFRGTPAAGAAWRLNVCRAQKGRAEFSCWNPVEKGFRNAACFGQVVFGPRPGGDVTLAEIATGNDLGPGNRVVLYLRHGADAPRAVAARLSVEPDIGTLEAATAVPPGATGELALGPYELHPVGTYTATLEITVAGKPWTVAMRRLETYPLPAMRARLDAFRDRTDGLAKRLGDDPELAAFLAEVEAVRQAAATVAAAEETAAVAAAKAVTPQLASVELRLANWLEPLLWRRETRAAGQVATGILSPSAKFFADEPFAGRFGRTAAILAARNEGESTQVVLFPQDAVADARVAWTSLRDAAGHELPAAALACHRVMDVWVAGPYSGRPDGRFWPDVLMPLTPADAFAIEQPTALMLTVRVPMEQPAGRYRGQWRLEGPAGVLATLDLHVEVLPFAIPRPSHFRSDLWVSEHHVHGIYGHPMTPEFYADLAERLGAYHMAPQLDRRAMLRSFAITRGADGSYSFAFDRYDPYLRAEMAAGRTHWNLGFEGSRFESVLGLFTGLPIVDAATGETVKSIPEGARALLQAYLKALTDHLRNDFGIPAERIYCSLGDEPWDDQQRASLREFGALVHAVTPAKRLAAGTHPGMGLDDVIDTWVPQIRQYVATDYPPGAEVHWYTCLNKYPLPDFHILAPGTAPRIQAWLAWRDHVTGFLYWSSIYWGTSNQYSAFGKSGGRSDAQRWAGPHWPQPFANGPFVGDATFFYPLPDGVTPSLRAQAYRDGVDDYEYLRRLDTSLREYEQAGGRLPGLVRARIAALLAVPAEVAESTHHWTHDGAVLDHCREQVARAILLLDRLRDGAPADPVDVTAVGAVGDGIADDTLALQYAIAMAVGRSSAVVIPRGVYRITAPLQVPTTSYSIAQAVRISGDWAVIRADRPMKACLDITPTSHFTLERLHVDGAGLADVGVNAFKISGRQGNVRQVTVGGARQAGFRLEKCQGSVFAACAAAGNAGVGWDIADGNAAVFAECSAMNNGGDGFVIRTVDFSGGCTLSNVWSEGNGGNGIVVAEAVHSPVVIRDGWLEGNRLDGIRLAGTDAVVTGVGVTGSGTGDNRAIHLLPSAAGCYVHGCFVQNGPGVPNFGRIRVDATAEDAAARHRIVDNFYRYRGTPVDPEYLPPPAE